MLFFFRCSHCRMPLFFLFLNKHLWQQESVQRASYANQSLFCVKNVFVCFVYDFKNLFSASVLVFFPSFSAIHFDRRTKYHSCGFLYVFLSNFHSLSSCSLLLIFARSLIRSHTHFSQLTHISVSFDKCLVNFPIHKNFMQHFWVSIKKNFRSSFFLFGLIE